MNKTTIQKNMPHLVIMAYLLMITFNILANALPLNGQTTANVSYQYNNLFTPAGITFSIWGLIYITLLGYTVYQFLAVKNEEHPYRSLIQKISPFYLVSSIANAFWIISWHFNLILLSTLFIITILISLIMINRKLKEVSMTTKDYLFIKLPFNIYFGWITVATVANITTWLVSIDWTGLGISDVVWADIIILLSGLIGFLSAIYYKSSAYAATLIWAFSGIFIQHVSRSGYGGEYTSIIMAVLIAIGLQLLALMIRKKTWTLKHSS